MKEIRQIHNLESSILHPLIGWKSDERTEEKYLKKIKKFERKCEQSLIETFSRIGVKSIVKTDPYSLPYNNEVVIELRGESYLNGPYEFYRVARRILKEVLDKNLWNVRFYIWIDVITPQTRTLLDPFGKVVYKFRYHLPKTE
jgi:hypothetical protein